MRGTRVVAAVVLAWTTGACQAGGDETDTTSEAGSTGSATDASSTAADSSGSDESTGEPAPTFDGEPLAITRDGAWEWFDIEGMACADGRDSGVGVRAVQDPEGVVLYFKGGGACFNTLSCALAEPLMVTGLEAIDQNPDGVLNFEDPQNPLANYDVVYFPYCTGDVHGGSELGVTPQGVAEPWDFVGHENVLAALDRLVPTFADSERLMVYGTSAGGIGALVNFPSIVLGWPDAETFLLDDSGMIYRDAYLEPCLQQTMRSTWSLSAALPTDCPECETKSGGGMAEYYRYLADRYPQTHFGIVASTRDRVTRVFFGFGNNECQPEAGLPDLGEATIDAALADLRAEVLDGRFASYVVDSDVHVWTATPEFYSVTSADVPLTEWFDEFLAGNASNVGP